MRCASGNMQHCECLHDYGRLLAPWGTWWLQAIGPETAAQPQLSWCAPLPTPCPLPQDALMGTLHRLVCDPNGGAGSVPALLACEASRPQAIMHAACR